MSHLDEQVDRVLLLRELRRVLQLLCGEDWRDVFDDLIYNYTTEDELEEIES